MLSFTSFLFLSLLPPTSISHGEIAPNSKLMPASLQLSIPFPILLGFRSLTSAVEGHDPLLARLHC
jgi:hypothetical protein